MTRTQERSELGLDATLLPALGRRRRREEGGCRLIRIGLSRGSCRKEMVGRATVAAVICDDGLCCCMARRACCADGCSLILREEKKN